MDAIENRMLIDSQWKYLLGEAGGASEAAEKLNNGGYKEMSTGNFVPEEDALEYAMERLYWDANLQKEFMEWFYSGNWIKED